jgi:hypothetical protein
MRCKYKELNEHCQLYQLMTSCHHFQPLLIKCFVQKSDVREKELANDVSVRNQILSIESYSTNLFSIFLLNIFTDI